MFFPWAEVSVRHTALTPGTVLDTTFIEYHTLQSRERNGEDTQLKFRGQENLRSQENLKFNVIGRRV